MLPRTMKYTPLLKKLFAFSIFIFAFFSFFYLLSSTPVFAVDGDAAITPDAFGTEFGASTGLGSEDIRLTIAKIIRALLGLLGILSLSIMVYAGYIIMTSGGEADKVTRGKKWMINAAIGLGIILSSFAIVQFVISRLADATGFQTSTLSGGTVDYFDNFSGSGSLGRVIEDHYPGRNQKNVKRNTKISVTFASSIDPESIFEDSNGSGRFGDCTDIENPNFSFENNCDQVKPSAVRVNVKDAEAQNSQMVGLSMFEAEDRVHTVSFIPLSLLGSEINDITYSVVLFGGQNGIKDVQGQNIFANARNDFYTWDFTTGTDLDLTPPQVVSVTPGDGKKAAKNTILQVVFSEPVDPTQVQGFVSAASPFSNIVMSNSNTTGQWKLSNGYTTVEFVSDSPCGKNSCGDQVYCLDVDCDGEGCSEDYTVLLRTAKSAVDSHQALPFSGIMDMAGNALDGDGDGDVTDTRPEPVGGKNILENELASDNYFWTFPVINSIRLSSPYIEQVTPGPDAEGVKGDAEVSIVFSQKMWLGTMGGITLEEFASEANRDEETRAKLAEINELWYRKKAEHLFTEINEIEKTKVYIEHREFGPNNLDLFYFPSVPSTVKDTTQNCIYPGRGPYTNTAGLATSPACVYELNPDGTPVMNAEENINCTPVTVEADMDSSCVETISNNNNATVVPDLEACRTRLQNLSSGVFSQ